MAASPPSAARAAPWVWALAGVLLIVGSCLGLSGLAFLLGDPAMIRQAMQDSEMTADQAAFFVDNAAAFGGAIVVFAVLLIGLAILLAVIGFSIRGGHAVAVFIARFVVGGVTLGFAALALLSVAGAILQAQPVQALLTLLIFGGPALLGGVATVRLFGPPRAAPSSYANPAGTPADPDDEPWNAHLPPR
jgi:hypothetical protein